MSLRDLHNLVPSLLQLLVPCPQSVHHARLTHFPSYKLTAKSMPPACCCSSSKSQGLSGPDCLSASTWPLCQVPFCHTEPRAPATLDPLALSKAPAHSGFCTWSPSWLSYCHGRYFNCSMCFSVLVCNTRIIQEPTSEVPGVVWKNPPLLSIPVGTFILRNTGNGSSSPPPRFLFPREGIELKRLVNLRKGQSLLT